MTTVTARKFYTITGIGWGVGEDIMDARGNYLEAQRRNFPNLSDEDMMACAMAAQPNSTWRT